MSENSRKRYSNEKLEEFETLLTRKLKKAQEELAVMTRALDKKRQNATSSFLKALEDNAELVEQESVAELAARQRKFIRELEAALIRVQNGTYGVCVLTGDLIPEDRLKIVPHTRHCLAAKKQAEQKLVASDPSLDEEEETA